MRLAVATTTWNSSDLIGLWLTHYRRLGAARAYVMDLGSTDGTCRLLDASEWRDFVDLVPFPGLARLVSSRLLLDNAKRLATDDDWCLFCDPDELIVTPRMHVSDLSSMTKHSLNSARIVPRFNVTGPLSALGDERALSATGGLVLRIDHRHPQRGRTGIDEDLLRPSWIFSAIGGKCLVHVPTTQALSHGDHDADTTTGPPVAANDGIYLLHYPFRTLDAFRSKVEMAKTDFDINPHIPLDEGWQVRRWVRLAGAGHLKREYEQQFIPDEELPHLIDSGAITIDTRIRDFHGAS